MPIDVIETLKEIISEHVTDVELYIKSLECNRRLQLETWA